MREIIHILRRLGGIPERYAGASIVGLRKLEDTPTDHYDRWAVLCGLPWIQDNPVFINSFVIHNNDPYIKSGEFLIILYTIRHLASRCIRKLLRYAF